VSKLGTNPGSGCHATYFCDAGADCVGEEDNRLSENVCVRRRLGELGLVIFKMKCPSCLAILNTMAVYTNCNGQTHSNNYLTWMLNVYLGFEDG
jgi:hypothetical protein